MTPFQTFAPLLRKQGFRKTWSTRSGGTRMDEWKKDVSATRTLELQLWADGGPRVSHMNFHPKDRRRGKTTTAPSEFEDEASLLAAIEHETTRADHEPFHDEKDARRVEA